MTYRWRGVGDNNRQLETTNGMSGNGSKYCMRAQKTEKSGINGKIDNLGMYEQWRRNHEEHTVTGIARRCN